MHFHASAARRKLLMRCVIVNGAQLKAETSCGHCGRKLIEGYVRDMQNRKIYCDFTCYAVAAGAPVRMPEQRLPAVSAWKRSS
jgi:hypothetical protein